MKKFSLVFCFLLFSQIISFAQTEQWFENWQDKTLRAICSVDKHLWMSFGWQIVYSPDSGETYQMRSLPNKKAVFQLDFIDTLNGFAYGDSNTFFTTNNGGQVWTDRQVSNFNGRIMSISFINPSVGWLIVGNAIYNTTNGGVNWTLQYSHTPATNLNDIQFVNATDGWACGDANLMLHTSDGGINWVVQNTPVVNCKFNSIFFLNNLEGWASHSNCADMYHTFDGGNTWTQIYNTGSTAFVDIKFYSPLIGFARRSTNSELYKTYDGGLTWTSIYYQNGGGGICYSDSNFYYTFTMYGLAVFFNNVGKGKIRMLHTLNFAQSINVSPSGDIRFLIDNRYIITSKDNGRTFTERKYIFDFTGSLTGNKLYYTSKNKGWLSTTNGKMWHTLDAGITYTSDSIHSGILGEIFFTNDNNGWVIGEPNILYHTTDEGITWNPTTFPTAVGKFRDLLFINPNVGWVIADSAIFHTIDGGVNWTSQLVTNLPATKKLKTIQFPDSMTGYIFREDEFFMKTFDAGLSWQTDTIDTTAFSYVREIYFRTPAEGWAVAYANRIYSTTDSGATWTRKNNFTSISSQNLDNIGGFGETVVVYVHYGAAMILSDNSNQINGKVFWDKNNNFVQDSADIPLENQQIRLLPTNHTAFTQANGTYSLPADSGSFNATCLNQTHFTTNPTSYAVNLPARKQIILTNKNFAYQATSFIDLKLDFSVTRLNPHRNNFMSIHYENIGTDTLYAAQINLVKPNNATIINSSLPIVSVFGDTIWFNLPTVAPFESGTILLQIQIPTTTPINTVFTWEGTIFPYNSDSYPYDNHVFLYQLSNLGYDPNDKQVYPETVVDSFMTNQSYLTYTIHFQNTGNDTAYFIRVEDKLSPKLDMNTFEMVASSHAVNISVLTDKQKIVWTIDPALLPDSTTNLLASNGFITFRIKPNPALFLQGDSIENSASIFFDFNVPVYTNTSKVHYKSLTTETQQNLPTSQAFQVFPNPNNGRFTLLFPENNALSRQIEVIDVLGKVVYSQTITAISLPIELPTLNKGIYIVKVVEDGKVSCRKVVVE